MRSLLLASLAGLALLAEARPASAQSDPDSHQSRCERQWAAVGDCWNRPWTGPELVMGLDLGLSGMVEGGPFGFGSGTGSVTSPGPAWGVRVGVDVLPWLGLEARYVGMYDGGKGDVTQAGNVGFLTTGGEAVARLVIPLRYIRPYAFGGVGFYDTSLQGSPAARAASTLTSNTGPGIPMGLGFEVPLTWHLSIGAEATFHFLLGESFSNAPARDIDGADLTTFNAVLKARL